jgi:hypothetical protein
MQLSTLAQIYGTVGECVSVYAQRDAAWSEVTARTDALGLDWPALRQVMETTPGAFGPDDAGVAAFAWPDRPPCAQGLPVPPVETIVRLGSLPYAAPLLETLEIAVPHVIVDVHGDESNVVTFGALDEPESAVVPTNGSGGFEEIVEAVVARVRTSAAEIAFVAADDGARNAVIDRLATRLPVDCEVIGIDPSDGDVAETTVRLVSDHTARGTVDTLHRFRFARSHGSTVEGVGDTIAALQAGRVRLLLVHDDPDDDRSAWVGDGATHIAASSDGDGAVGLGKLSEARLVDAAIRSALLAGGRAHSIPGHVGDGPAEGIGATLTV